MYLSKLKYTEDLLEKIDKLLKKTDEINRVIFTTLSL
jgi:hypothetical protein